MNNLAPPLFIDFLRPLCDRFKLGGYLAMHLPVRSNSKTFNFAVVVSSASQVKLAIRINSYFVSLCLQSSVNGRNQTLFFLNKPSLIQQQIRSILHTFKISIALLTRSDNHSNLFKN